MNEDFSLANLHYHGLCTAIEHGGIICFNQIEAKGYCWKHYYRVRRYGSINLPPKPSKRCKFILCDQDYYSSGYCKNHYAQHARRNASKKCSAEGCDINCIGTYCPKHRGRLDRYGTLEGSGKKKGCHFKPGHTYIRKKEYKTCLAKECGRDSNAYKITKGLCPKHYSRWLKHGEYNL